MTAASERLVLCECTHAPRRHEDGTGVCQAQYCDCTVYRAITPDGNMSHLRVVAPVAPVVVPKPVKPTLTVSAILEEARTSGVPRLAAAANKLIKQAFELQARLTTETQKEQTRLRELEDARKARVQARIDRIEAELAEARKELSTGKRAAKKPVAVVAEGGGFPCRHCPTVSKSAGGRGSHEYSKHNISAR